MLTHRQDAAPAVTRRARFRNPFTSTSLGGRLLSGAQLPFFLFRPPAGYGIIRTVGRRTGRVRSRCVRLAQRGDTACVVSIHGRNVGWIHNISADPNISVRTASGWRRAVATVGHEAVSPTLRAAYVDDTGWFCYPEFLMWRRGRPTVAGIRELHSAWIESGTPVALQLEV